MAAEPISITVGGNSHWGIAVVDNDLDGKGTDADGEALPETDDIAISNDVELRFAGSTVLDSGVEVGVRIEIEGEESSDQGDETYAYVEGSFGTLRIGNDDPASYSMGTAAPYATYFYGINTPYWSGSFTGNPSNWHSTFADAGAGDSASVMYYSPVINGFQFGVSYAPEAGSEAQSGTAGRGKGHDVYAVGARYDGAFGDAGVTIAAGYASKDVPKVAAVDPMPARYDIKIMDFTATQVYLTADGSSPSTQAGEDVPVFENPMWKPNRDDFTVPDGTDAAQAQTNYETALTAYETAVENEATTYNADLNGDGTATPVYKYHQVGSGENSGNEYYMTDGEAAMPGRTVTDYSVGVVVSMSGVSVGGSYRATDDDKTGSDDMVQYDVGISYGEGPWVVSLNYGNMSQDDNGKGVKTDNDYSRLMANYNLGPGINLAGVIGRDSFNVGDNDGDTTFAGMALGISF